MDLGLPDIEGYEATRKIRELKKTSVPIVALTAHDAEKVHEDCLKAGMNGSLTKPLNSEKIHSTINKWVCGQCNSDINICSCDERTKQSQIVDIQDKIINWDFVVKFTGDMKQAKNLVSEFIKTLKEEQKQIEEAMKNNNFTLIAQITHKIKGAATYCGTSKLQAAAADLETAARNKQKDNVGKLLNNLIKAVKEVTEAFAKE